MLFRSTISVTNYDIGSTGPGGGIVFYDKGNYSFDGNGYWRYLEVAPVDQSSTGIIWAIVAYQATAVPGGTGTVLGSGFANTEKIITQNGAGITYAAGLVRAYNGGGKSDWFLPSKDELSAIWNSGVGIPANSYWSSSEVSNSVAWVVSFSDGSQNTSAKFGTGRIRAVRAF